MHSMLKHNNMCVGLFHSTYFTVLTGVSVYVYTVGECISRAGDMVFLKNVGHHNFLGLLFPRRPYIELFCVEQKVKIIIHEIFLFSLSNNKKL